MATIICSILSLWNYMCPWQTAFTTTALMATSLWNIVSKGTAFCLRNRRLSENIILSLQGNGIFHGRYPIILWPFPVMQWGISHNPICLLPLPLLNGISTSNLQYSWSNLVCSGFFLFQQQPLSISSCLHGNHFVQWSAALTTCLFSILSPRKPFFTTKLPWQPFFTTKLSWKPVFAELCFHGNCILSP